MVARQPLRTTLLGRDVAVAYAALVALYLLRFTGLQAAQIPAYLLIVAYDFVEVALPILTPYHPVAFPLFLYLLALVGAGVARRLGPPGASAWKPILGSVCLLVGAISLAFGAFVGGPIVAPADNPTPLAITGGTALVLLTAAWVLLGRPRPRPVDRA